LYPVGYLANLTMGGLAIGQSRTNLLSFTYQIGDKSDIFTVPSIPTSHYCMYWGKKF
jgi:hypothetical protein